MTSGVIKVVRYIRVSTEGQVKQGFSLGEQQAEIERYCGSKSYKLVNTFKEEGISGGKTNEDELCIEREGLRDMLASLKDNDIQYVVVLNTNRLWRNTIEKYIAGTQRRIRDMQEISGRMLW